MRLKIRRSISLACLHIGSLFSLLREWARTAHLASAIFHTKPKARSGERASSLSLFRDTCQHIYNDLYSAREWGQEEEQPNSQQPTAIVVCPRHISHARAQCTPRRRQQINRRTHNSSHSVSGQNTANRLDDNALECQKQI